jgi:hypothetical protein
MGRKQKAWPLIRSRLAYPAQGGGGSYGNNAHDSR